MNTPLQIYGYGEHYHAVTDSLPELKSVTQAATGKAIRRIGRFIQLALIGAARCQHGQTLPTDTAVYLASGRGDLELTLEIMTELFRNAQVPKPLNFVNTVSNAACFYVAQALGLHSRSNFVCNRYFAFESALQLAALDLHSDVVDSALIGSIDIATTPLHEHRQRLHLAADTPIGEGSHWLWLGKIDAARPRLGELLAAQHFADREQLLSWINQQSLFSRDCQVAAGQFLHDDDFGWLCRESGLSKVFDYRAQRGYYDCQSGAAIGEFLQQRSNEHLLHINAGPDQRYSVMLIAA